MHFLMLATEWLIDRFMEFLDGFYEAWDTAHGRDPVLADHEQMARVIEYLMGG